MFTLKSHPVQDLPEVLHVALTGVLADEEGAVTPPEYHLLVMALTSQLDESQCFVLLDLEEVSLEDFPVLSGLQEQEIMGWGGEELPGMLGYGGLSVFHSDFGPVLTISLGGSLLQSASTLFIVPEELLA